MNSTTNQVTEAQAVLRKAKRALKEAQQRLETDQWFADNAPYKVTGLGCPVAYAQKQLTKAEMRVKLASNQLARAKAQAKLDQLNEEERLLWDQACALHAHLSDLF